MQHSHDLNAARNGEIEDYVTAHRETAQTLDQRLPPPPEPALLSQHLELLIDQINERIGLLIAVIGNELPDFRENHLGASLENNHRHGLCVLVSSTARGLALAPIMLDLLGARWNR